MGVGYSVPKPAPVPEASKDEAKKPTAESVHAAPKTHEEPKGPNSRFTNEVPKAKEEPPTSVHVPREPVAKPKNVPHMYEAIIKGAGNPSDGSLLDKIRSGVFLNNKKQKYWVDDKTGYNCFMLFARGLLITWSENEQFWQWLTLKETSDMEIEMASLQNVCWLEVHGRFETSHLTPGVMYEVVFMVMMTKQGHGWDKPVNLRLKLPDRIVAQREVCLLEMPKGQWTELKVGEFMVEIRSAGEMEFSLYEYEGGQWKRGLVIRGAIIRPKK